MERLMGPPPAGERLDAAAFPLPPPSTSSSSKAIRVELTLDLKDLTKNEVSFFDLTHSQGFEKVVDEMRNASKSSHYDFDLAQIALRWCSGKSKYKDDDNDEEYDEGDGFVDDEDLKSQGSKKKTKYGGFFVNKGNKIELVEDDDEDDDEDQGEDKEEGDDDDDSEEGSEGEEEGEGGNEDGEGDEENAGKQRKGNTSSERNHDGKSKLPSSHNFTKKGSQESDDFVPASSQNQDLKRKSKSCSDMDTSEHHVKKGKLAVPNIAIKRATPWSCKPSFSQSTPSPAPSKRKNSSSSITDDALPASKVSSKTQPNEKGKGKSTTPTDPKVGLKSPTLSHPLENAPSSSLVTPLDPAKSQAALKRKLNEGTDEEKGKKRKHSVEGPNDATSSPYFSINAASSDVSSPATLSPFTSSKPSLFSTSSPSPYAGPIVFSEKIPESVKPILDELITYCLSICSAEAPLKKISPHVENILLKLGTNTSDFTPQQMQPIYSLINESVPSLFQAVTWKTRLREAYAKEQKRILFTMTEKLKPLVEQAMIEQEETHASIVRQFNEETALKKTEESGPDDVSAGMCAIESLPTATSENIVKEKASDDEEPDELNHSQLPSSQVIKKDKDKKARPRKHFKWTDEITQLLNDIYQVHQRLCRYQNKGSDESLIRLRTFLMENVIPLWPKKWMGIGRLAHLFRVKFPVVEPSEASQKNPLPVAEKANEENLPLEGNQPSSVREENPGDHE